MSKKIEEFGKVIFEFEVLYVDWESDNKAYVVENENGRREVIMSNHGNFYVAKTRDVLDKIAEYEQAITNSKKAISLITS
jgi:hypothetical protein